MKITKLVLAAALGFGLYVADMRAEGVVVEAHVRQPLADEHLRFHHCLLAAFAREACDC